MDYKKSIMLIIFLLFISISFAATTLNFYDIITKETCVGCITDNKCLAYGIRSVSNNVPSYCDITGQTLGQKQISASCQNNYECLSNQCSNGVCIDIQKDIKETQGMLQTIMDWLKNLF